MYQLELTPLAQRHLDKLPDRDLERVQTVLRDLREDPRPRGTRKLRGPIHRIRVGDWRVIYAVFDRDRLVIVGKVARSSEQIYDRVDELF